MGPDDAILCNSCGLRYSRQLKRWRKSFNNHSRAVQYCVNIGATTTTSDPLSPGRFFKTWSLQSGSQDSPSTYISNTVPLSNSDQYVPASSPSATTDMVPLFSIPLPVSCDTALEMQPYTATSYSTTGLEGYEPVTRLQCLDQGEVLDLREANPPIHDIHTALFQMDDALVQTGHADNESGISKSDTANGSDGLKATQPDPSVAYQTTVQPIHSGPNQDLLLPMDFHSSFPSHPDITDNWSSNPPPSQLHRDNSQFVPLSTSGFAVPPEHELNTTCYQNSCAGITASQHTYWPLFELFGLNRFLGQIAKSLSPYLEMALDTFYRRAAAVHFEALQHDSSIYVAAETFVCDYAGISHVISAFALTREGFGLTASHHYGELATAKNDLVFDFAVVGPAISPASLDPCFRDQNIVTHFNSSRMQSAIWKLSRLTLGPHLPDSASFRWLRGSFKTVITGEGPQSIMTILSGSEKYGYRRFYQALADSKYLSNPAHSSTETDDACVKSVQEWLIAIQEEVATRPSLELQKQLLQAHQSYMLANLDVFVRAFEEVGSTECLHTCSFNCSSHAQPSFRSLFDKAREALHQLFSDPDLLRNIQGFPQDYPTQQQLFHARVVGLSLCKFYVSADLFPEEKEIQHFGFTRDTLLKERRAFLPVDVSQRAAVRLEYALKKCKRSGFQFSNIFC